ncbi:hypothetical protein D3C72_1256390 [compost metagenome]
MGAAPDACQAGVESRHASVQSRQHIGKAQAARVMEMRTAQAVAGDTPRLFEQAAHRRRIGIAHGVGQAHAIGARIQQRLHQAQHLVRPHLALQGAAEGRSHPALDQRGRTGRVARGPHLRDHVHHFLRRLAQIRQAVCMAGRQRHQHQMGAAGQGTFGALHVGHQHRYRQAGQAPGMGDQIAGVRQLRQ